MCSYAITKNVRGIRGIRENIRGIGQGAIRGKQVRIRGNTLLVSLLGLVRTALTAVNSGFSMMTGSSTANQSSPLMPSATRTFSENGEMSY